MSTGVIEHGLDAVSRDRFELNILHKLAGV
jgi:hypothetical protein